MRGSCRKSIKIINGNKTGVGFIINKDGIILTCIDNVRDIDNNILIQFLEDSKLYNAERN